MKTVLCSQLLVFIFSFACFSQQQHASQKSLKGIEKFIEKTSTEWMIPGVAIGVIKDGQVVYAKGFGYRDLDKKLPVNEHTLFNIASNNKSLPRLVLANCRIKVWFISISL